MFPPLIILPKNLQTFFNISNFSIFQYWSTSLTFLTVVRSGIDLSLLNRAALSCQQCSVIYISGYSLFHWSVILFMNPLSLLSVFSICSKLICIPSELVLFSFFFHVCWSRISQLLFYVIFQSCCIISSVDIYCLNLIILICFSLKILLHLARILIPSRIVRLSG